MIPITRFQNSLYYFYSVLYSRIYDVPLIHVIGDSHVKAFRMNKSFVTHHIHGATANNLKRKNSTSHSNERLFSIVGKINEKDIVMLAFGEIDCRIHVYYQFKKNGEKYTISDLIDMTVSNYIEVLEQVREHVKNPCVYSVAPSTTVGNEYDYPYYADPEMRSEITRTFNARLEDFCKKNNFAYIDIYPNVSDESGFMLPEYTADKIHLNNKVVDFVKIEIKRKLGVSV